MLADSLVEFEKLTGHKVYGDDATTDRILMMITDWARYNDDWRMDNFIREASESTDKVVYRDHTRRVTFVGGVNAV